MLRTCIVLACVLASSPVLAASTPEDLVHELNQAVHAGNLDAYRAALSAKTRRAMKEADAAGSSLDLAQRNYSDALNERFGSGPVGGGSPFHMSPLSRYGSISLVSVQQRSQRGALLRLRIITRGRGQHPSTDDHTFPAVVEVGQWKLDLTGITRSIIRTEMKWQAAYERVTQQIRAGAFTNQVAAFVALERVRPRSSAP